MTSPGWTHVRASVAVRAAAARALTAGVGNSGLPCHPSPFEVLREAGLVSEGVDEDPSPPVDDSSDCNAAAPTSRVRRPRTQKRRQQRGAAAARAAAKQIGSRVGVSRRDGQAPAVCGASAVPQTAAVCRVPVRKQVRFADVVTVFGEGNGASAHRAVPPEADVNDYMLRDAFYAPLAKEYGPFDADLAADALGKNARCERFYSLSDPAQCADLRGLKVYCNGPFLGSAYAQILANYRKCKQEAPHTTSGVFVVPDWPDADFMPLLDGMRLVRYFPRGMRLFTAPPKPGSTTRSPAGPARWPVCVFWDPPVPTMEASLASDDASFTGQPTQSGATTATGHGDGRQMHAANSVVPTLAPSGHRFEAVGARGRATRGVRTHRRPDISTIGTLQAVPVTCARVRKSEGGCGEPSLHSHNPMSSGMTLKGYVIGAEVEVFLDTGAEGRLGNFMSADLFRRLGLRLDPGSAPDLVTATGQQSSTMGTTTVRLALKARGCTWRQRMRFTVAELSPDTELILGVPWFLEWNPQIDWDRNEVSMRTAPKFVFDASPRRRGVARKLIDRHAEQAREAAFSANCRVELRQLSANQFAKEFANDMPEEVFLFFVREAEDLRSRVGVENKPSHLPADIDPRVRQLLEKYKAVFPERLPTGEPKHPFRHRITTLPGAEPYCRYPYRLSRPELEEAEVQIKDLIATGRIRVSSSPWGAPILFARKKDGGLRMCVDYRALNKLTEKNKYPLPRIDDLLDRLRGARFFTSLDLASGFWQIPVAEEDRAKTAFLTPMGQYEWNVMPFGLCNAPSTFQSAMDTVLRGFVGHFAVVYIDDILIYSDTIEDHLRHLEMVFKRLQSHDLHCRPHKCSFLKSEVKFLGFIVGSGSQRVDPETTRAVREWPAPREATHVRQFLGLVNHCRKYIRGLATIALPLTGLMSPKNPFVWTPECQRAFDTLKAKLCEAPVLRLYDPDRPIRVVTDASDRAIGGVLLQDFGEGWQPVSYDSQKLKPAETRYSTYDRELLAILRALRHWRCYLFGQHFEVITDHATLRHLMTQPLVTNSRRIRWLDEMSDYSFEILYAPGKTNPADPLSRIPYLDDVKDSELERVVQTEFGFEEAGKPLGLRNLVATVTSDTALVERLRRGYEEDPFFTSPTNRELFEERAGLLYFRGRVCVPDDRDLRSRLMRELHETEYSGHFGIRRTLDAVSRLYYWPRMARDVRSFVKSCRVCQRTKVLNQRPAGELASLPVPTRRWEDISMDLITHLPTSPDTGHNSIVVFVDRLTKMTHFVPCHHTITATQLAELFIQHIFRLHGLPRTVVSDRDSKFTSDFWRYVFKRLGTKLAMSSGYHPQTDGQTERMNRTLEEMLRAFCGSSGLEQTWETYLPLAEFQYNNGVQASTGYSPFFLNSGQHPHTPASLTAGSDAVTMRVPAAETWLKAMEEALAAARAAMERAQTNQAAYYNRTHRSVEYKVGDKVYVAVQALPNKRRGSKLADRRQGPYRVTQRIGKNAYRLDLPVTWNVHPVFHVSYLEPARPDTHGWHEPPKLQQVLEGRWVGPTGQRTLWLKVRHEKLRWDEDLWMTAAELQQAAPAVYLDWHKRQDPLTAPVAILAERVSEADGDDSFGLEYRVLYNDNAKLWVQDSLLRRRAPALVQEWQESHHPETEEEAERMAAAAPAPPTPLMRLAVHQLCGSRWVNSPEPTGGLLVSTR